MLHLPSVPAIRCLLTSFCAIIALAAHSAFAEYDTSAGVENAQRAKINWMLNCQGCHGAADRPGHITGVPPLKDFVGNFLKVEGGREFIIQVPGSASAAVSDAELAELINWMLYSLSSAQLPPNFAPYTEEEVSPLRAKPLTKVEPLRSQLVEKIEAANR